MGQAGSSKIRWWRNLIVWECIAWGIGASLIALYRFTGWPSPVSGWYEPDGSGWGHRLLPSGYGKGLAGLSYISLVTGLNLAMVKFELFRKTQKDVMEQWQSDLAAQLEKHPSIVADDERRQKLFNYCLKTVKKWHGVYNTKSLKWRSIAVRLTVLGTACLYFQHSAGALGVLFLSPIIASWRSKCKCKSELERETDTIIEFVREEEQEQRKEQPEIEKLIQQLLAEAAKGG